MQSEFWKGCEILTFPLFTSLARGSCIPDCEPGTYFDSELIRCGECHHTCRTCVGEFTPAPQAGGWAEDLKPREPWHLGLCGECCSIDSGVREPDQQAQRFSLGR